MILVGLLHHRIYLSSIIYLSYIQGRPKWIPLYDRRTLIDGRSHKSTWSSIFDVDGSTVDAVDQDAFITRLQALAYRPCLGKYIDMIMRYIGICYDKNRALESLLDIIIIHHHYYDYYFIIRSS